MNDNYINLMEKQPVSSMIQGSQNRAQSTIDQYVIKKINDSSNVELSDLGQNDNGTTFTSTPISQWLTFEFMRKERLTEIKGKLNKVDHKVILIECEYLDQKKEWISSFNSEIKDVLNQKIFPPLTAYGVRFRNQPDSEQPLQFLNLKIIAKAGRPYVKQQNPWDNAQMIHNKYEIVNLMNFQTFYKKIDEFLVGFQRPVVTKINDSSAYDNEEITNNLDQAIHQYCASPPQWLTYEFDRKYKLSKIEIQLYKKDRRKYDYQLEVMDKNKNWIQVDAGRSGYKPIEVEFINFYPCYGIRVKGLANVATQHGVVVVSMKIFAQRGNPRIIKG